MPIPDFGTIMLPLLKLAADGNTQYEIRSISSSVCVRTMRLTHQVTMRALRIRSMP